jgi:competence protein ComEA
LGLPKTVINRILKYRQNGGRFKVKADFKKIYGVDSMLWNAIHTRLELPDSIMRQGFTAGQRAAVASEIITVKTDLNVADSAALKKIYGIGNTLAGRIVRYRDRLGGFVSINQLYEVYRLDSNVVEEMRNRYFVTPDFEPRKLNINTESRGALATHPYISNQVAAAIVAYRFQHGKFESMADLRKVMPLDSITLRKLTPYLQF